MSPEFYFYLKVSALIFFNLICIFGLIVLITIWISILNITDKTSRLLDNLQSLSASANEASSGIFEALLGFVSPRRSIWHYVKRWIK